MLIYNLLQKVEMIILYNSHVLRNISLKTLNELEKYVLNI